jgi:sterol desaturase/sphingolipid hydroxylase (fatty acid hydroxylase superfamily)
LLLTGAALRWGIPKLSPVSAALGTSGGVLRNLPEPAAFVVALLLLDLAKYGTHRLFHTVAWLWPIHRVHHSDPDFDVSTGLRFHPLEPLLPLGAELALIWGLGVPVSAVVATQVLVCASNFFQHANANLPEPWERYLGQWLVTPHFHRVHHSDQISDQQNNFGELFPWWDRGLGTYRKKATGEGVGLRGYQDESSMRLAGMLLQPMQPSREPLPPSQRGV